MKKAKKKSGILLRNIGLFFLIIGGANCIFSIIGYSSSEVSFFESLVFSLIGVPFLYLHKRKSASKVKPSVPEGEMNYCITEEIYDGGFLSYEYEKEIAMDDGAISFVRGNGGKEILFQQEPENQYDQRAVAIYLQGHKLGYVHRGTVQDMVNDYISRGWPVFGYLNKYSVAENKATFKIAFYKPLSLYSSKSFSLTKIQKKSDEYRTREDNLSSCEIGEVFTVEYDSEDGGYVAFDSMLREVGSLPASAENFIRENSPDKIVAILDSIDVDFNGRAKARVTVYLID